MKHLFKYMIMMVLAAVATTACTDHIPEEEELPNAAVTFTYSIVDEVYQLDYYVGAQIEFVSTGAAQGECTWDFGDGTTATGNKVIHKFNTTATYQVRLTVAGAGYSLQPIFISDIKPILGINPFEDEVCEVEKTFVSFNVELPNPEKLEEVYTWTFPAGTLNESDAPIATYEGKDPGKVKFSNVGSQSVRLNVTLGGRPLEESLLNVQVAYNKEVPTLYYATKSGNIMAYKLINDAPATMQNMPFDMGVKSGQHPLNILFNDSSLYIIDCGQQFTYVNDEDNNLGDGKITVMSYNGTRVETMLSNTSNAFDDPYYGYIEGGQLYFANRNTGIHSIKLNERNQSYSVEQYPWFVQNDHLGYYGNGLSYGAMNACFGKINGTWYWCKTYNGNGIFRFVDGDILQAPREATDPVPAAGLVLSGMAPKSYVWDAKNGVIYFSIYDTGNEGIYRCTLAELEAINNRAALAPYLLKTADGKSVTPITETGMGEGSSGEFIGICQMTLDETTGNVYFGLRSADATVPSGLWRYNAQTSLLEPVIEGISIYGVTINPRASKLF